MIALFFFLVAVYLTGLVATHNAETNKVNFLWPVAAVKKLIKKFR